MRLLKHNLLALTIIPQSTILSWEEDTLYKVFLGTKFKTTSSKWGEFYQLLLKISCHSFWYHVLTVKSRPNQVRSVISIALSMKYYKFSKSSGTSRTFAVLRNVLNTSVFDTPGGAILETNTSNPDMKIKELSICLRFRLEVLGGYTQRLRGSLINIGDW